MMSKNILTEESLDRQLFKQRGVYNLLHSESPEKQVLSFSILYDKISSWYTKEITEESICVDGFHIIGDNNNVLWSFYGSRELIFSIHYAVNRLMKQYKINKTQ